MAEKPAYEELEERVKELEQAAVERKRAEVALRQSEERFRAIFEAAQDSIFIKDRAFRYTHVNPAMESLFGLPSSELVGKTDEELFGKEAGRHIREVDSKVLNGKIIEEESAKPVHGILKTFHVIKVPMFDDSSQVIGLYGIARDISARKRAEEALRKAHDKLEMRIEERTAELIKTNEKLKGEIEERKRMEEALEQEKCEKEMIMDSIVELVAYQNLENKVLWANRAACESVHKTREALLGQHCYEVWAGRQSVCEDCPVAKAINTGNPQAIEKTTPDGRCWYIQGYPVRGINRDIVGAVELTLDVTARRKAEEETRKLEAKLVQAQKLEAIGTLAGGIAHDFNNLLMGIQGNVSLMLFHIDTEHPHYERLKNIEKQVQSGARLTSHLLGYARKGQYEVKPIDLNHLVRETSESFGRTRKDISIDRQLREDLFAIDGDSGQIEQVLWNLFVNAADAMPGGGDLILQSDNVTHEDMRDKLYDPRPGSYVLLTVADTGLGMDKQTVDRIFDPFFTTKEMGRGTGLGLASAYGIIKAHAGYIDVESDKGVGTTFSIYLPSSDKKVQKVVKDAQEVIEGTESVLLIDDEEVILEVGKDLLEAMGYRVLTARDGKEAIEIYKNNRDKIDLVILDMVMPRMGGGEAYDKMKEISPNVKVLLSSGYSIDSQAKEILQRGCNGFIQKPFKMKELSHAIREVLGTE